MHSCIGHKQPQLIFLDDTAADNSLTLIKALLVHPSGTVHSIVDCFIQIYRVIKDSVNKPGCL